jgi:uncharacterized protein YbjT (DUF2867 family)
VILVTSGNGHIGKEVMNVLRSRDMKARAFVREAERGQEDQSGVLEYLKGDFFDGESLRRAFVGVDRVMHISPPHIPGEFAIGQTMIELCGERHVRHFALLPSILDRPMTFVDRRDVAEAVAIVLSDDKHFRAIFEFVGTEPITAPELAGLVSQGRGRSIQAKRISADAIIDRLLRTSVIDAFTSDAFERMFVYYNRHGLTGNSNLLGWLLGRKPTGFPGYLWRADAEKQ